MATPNPIGTELDNRLANLRKSYELSLLEQVKQLQAIAQTSLGVAPGKDACSSLEKARSLSHKLAGSAGTFGYSKIGQLARALEDLFDEAIEHHGALSLDEQKRIEMFIQEIARETKKLVDDAQQSHTTNAAPANSNPVAISDPSPGRPHRALIALGGALMARDLLFALERHGFDVQVQDAPDTALAYARETRPDVAVIFLDQDNVSGFDLADTLWKEKTLSNLEIFFFVRPIDLVRKASLNGIPDEWFLFSPMDTQEIAARILQRIFNIKAGRERGNRAYLAAHLEILKQLLLLRNDPLGPSQSEFLRQTPVQDNSGKRVLVVDDDRHLAEAIVETLRDKGLEVAQVHSGIDGLNHVKKQETDLIITDFNMPNGSGEYFLTNLRKSDPDKKIKIILITGEKVLKNFRLDEDAYRRLNVASQLIKPLNLEHLCSEVLRQLHS